MKVYTLLLQSRRGSIPDRNRGFFLYLLRPDQLWGPPNLPHNGYWVVLAPEVKRDRDVMLTTPSSLLMPTLILSRSYTPSLPKRLRGVQWDHFTFTATTSVPFIVIRRQIVTITIHNFSSYFHDFECKFGENLCITGRHVSADTRIHTIYCNQF
jgi:hypothetical protein